MRVLFFTQSDEICAASRTRVYQYLPFLRSKGVECKVIPMVKGLIYKGAFISPENRIKKLAYVILSLILNCIKGLQVLILAGFYDVIFIQRILIPKPIAYLLRKINANIIFDFDDAIYTADNPKSNLINRLKVNRNKKCLPYMLSISRTAIIENEYNRKFAGQFVKNIHIITGPIDTRRYKASNKDLPQKGAEDVVIGWIGSPSTTAYLNPLKDVFRELSRKYKITLKLIGASSFDIPDIKVVKKKWDLNTEVSELRSFDIGIMFLPDDEWTRGKGGYKLLQYLAMAVPAVATPVGINSEIIQDGVSGFLVNKSKEWIEKLSLLIDSPELRRKMGKEGRKTIEQKFSVEVSAPKILNILKDVYQRG